MKAETACCPLLERRGHYKRGPTGYKMTDSYSDTPAAKAPSASLWLALKDAIRGTNADYTRIPWVAPFSCWRFP